MAMMLFGSGASAQSAADYPNRFITIVVGFPPGGANDILARALAQGMSREFGQSVIVLNKPGAAGNVGTTFVADAAPDGYTLLLLPENVYSINPSIYGPAVQGVVDRLAPVANLVGGPPVIAVSTTGPFAKFGNIGDMIADIKAEKIRATFATAGSASPAYLAGMLLKKRTGADLINVPYGGNGPAITDLIGGRVSMMIGMLPGIQPFVEAGKLKLIGTAGVKRFSLIPDVPTIAESFPGIAVLDAEVGFAAPLGTPRPIIDKLNFTLRKLMQDQAVAQVVRAGGTISIVNSPEEYARQIKETREERARIIAEAGIKLQAAK
jgi:tripartite-type tricarboxylate transporter receptor subunit TctC